MSKCRIPTAAVAKRGLFRILLGSSIQHSSILQILDDLSDLLKKVTYPANCNDIVKTVIDDIMFAYNAEKEK